MKKLLSLVLCALLLLTPVLGAAAEEDASLLDQLWAMSDCSYLVDWGVLTDAEAAMLSADKAAVEAGRELVRTATVTTGPLTGNPDGDAALAALLERVTFVERSQRNEETLALLLDGEEALTFSLGEQDGLYVLGSSLLPGAVSLNAADLETLPTRLVTAAQENGLISSQEAMQFGMMMGGDVTPVGMAMPTWVRLIGMEVDVSALDLTAWNAVLSGVQERIRSFDMTIGAEVPVCWVDKDDVLQPADCDAAARVWMVTVTPEDVTDFVRAALITVRDNPSLADALAELLDYNRMAALYSDMGSFTEELIDPLLTELEAAETLLPMQLDITGYVDAQGETVRLEIDMLDTSMTSAEVTIYAAPETTVEIGDTDMSLENFADYFTLPSEPELLLSIVYNRRTAENETVHEVLMGDDEYRVYFEYRETPGSYAITMGDLEDGVRTEQISGAFGWNVSREDGETTLTANLLYQYPTTDYVWNEESHDFDFISKTCELAYALEAEVTDAGFRLCLNGRNTAAEEPLCVDMVVDCAVDGFDLTGTEQIKLRYGDDVMFAYAADLRTQEPAGSILAEEAQRLADMTDEGLTDWVAQVKANAEAWYAAQQNGWVGDLVELMDVQEPEVEASVVYTAVIDENSAVASNMYLLETSGLDDWSVETIEGADVVKVDELQFSLDEEYPEVYGYVGLFFTGLKEGEATVVLTEHSTTDDHPEGVYRITTIRLAVDAEGIVEMLERSTWTEYGVTVQ